MFDQSTLNRVYRYCIALTQDEDHAFDLMQTGVLKFLTHKGLEMDKPYAYLLAIVRNQFFDDQRRQHLITWEEFNENHFEEKQWDHQDPLSILIQQESIEEILKFVTDPERELLYLWAVEEYTVQEIANQTKISKGTLLSRLFRLRKKILRYLDKGKKEHDHCSEKFDQKTLSPVRAYR